MRRRSNSSEVSQDGFLQLVRAYAAISAHISHYQEIEHQILRLFNDASKSRPQFSDMSGILGSTCRSKEMTTRRAAWVAQHVFKNRAYCVGYQTVQERTRSSSGSAATEYSSAVVQQVEFLGFSAKQVNFANFMKWIEDTDYLARIDGVSVDPEGILYPFIGVAASQLHPGCAVGQVNSAGPSLFPTDRPIASPIIPAKRLRGLILAQWILATSFPQLDVRPRVIIVDEADAGWEFQVHATEGISLKEVSGGWKSITERPLVSSSTRLRNSGMDVSAMETLADIPVKDPLNALPVDRAARAYMLLNVMWERQAASERLELFTPNALAAEVSNRNLVVYPRDLLRHDIEDCLERYSLVARPRYEGVRLAMTAEGVAQMLILRKRFATLRDDSNYVQGDANILAPIRKQAILWAEYGKGRAVV